MREAVIVNIASCPTELLELLLVVALMFAIVQTLKLEGRGHVLTHVTIHLDLGTGKLDPCA